MKKLLNLYWNNPKFLLYHLGAFIVTMFLVPAFAIIPTMVLEIPMTWLFNDWFGASYDQETLSTLLLSACSYWLGAYTVFTKIEVFRPLFIADDEWKRYWRWPQQPYRKLKLWLVSAWAVAIPSVVINWATACYSLVNVMRNWLWPQPRETLSFKIIATIREPLCNVLGFIY